MVERKNNKLLKKLQIKSLKEKCKYVLLYLMNLPIELFYINVESFPILKLKAK